MISWGRVAVLLFFFLTAGSAFAQPKLIDAHLHYNGDPAFLKLLLAKLDSVDGLAFLLVDPKDLDGVKDGVKLHANRLVGFGEIQLDAPDVLRQIDRFHAAGFRGLGELSGPKHNYDDPVYSPIYARAEKYGMFILFHTGIVNRTQPEIPADISVDRMRATTLDNIARRYPKITIIGAHLGNPDYAWAAEITRWNPNIYWDLSGSTLIKKQEDYTFFKSIFWWSGIASPHTPKGGPSSFERIVFGSDVFGGELEEFDRELERYHKMLDTCGVSPEAQANIFAGTLWRILNKP
ncbi:MAG TPA: amidohydrolase family protein [Bryobacteraceae bacterium]|jgi:predicted TIM-barrel fold metal-dependent hydrolase|nr:amidohydrolase family protein [Bryobacteraceae bacterium]